MTAGARSGVVAVVETYEAVARRILARPARLGRTRLVAVDGPSGAGKTAFAARLAEALRTVGEKAARIHPVDEVPVLHTDDLLDGWADQFTFWPRLERWVLAPLRAGRPGRYRRYDWRRKQFDPQWIPVPPAPVVILEGVSSARARVRPELSFAVFVTAPVPVRRARALARDGVELLPHLQEWWRGEEVHFAADATPEHVDLVVDGSGTAEAGYVRIVAQRDVGTGEPDPQPGRRPSGMDAAVGVRHDPHESETPAEGAR